MDLPRRRWRAISRLDGLAEGEIKLRVGALRGDRRSAAFPTLIQLGAGGAQSCSGRRWRHLDAARRFSSEGRWDSVRLPFSGAWRRRRNRFRRLCRSGNHDDLHRLPLGGWHPHIHHQLSSEGAVNRRRGAPISRAGDARSRGPRLRGPWGGGGRGGRIGRWSMHRRRDAVRRPGWKICSGREVVVVGVASGGGCGSGGAYST